MRTFYFTAVISFFLACSQLSEIGCLPYFHTWCGLSANLECMSEICCTWFAHNTDHKNSPSVHHRTTLSGYIFATKACIDSWKKIVKQQYLYMSSQYELWPTNRWVLLATLGHPSQQISTGFASWTSQVTQRRSTKLHNIWTFPGLVDYIYILGGLAPLTEFYQVPNSLCVQVLRSPILATVLHGTRVVGVRQTAAWYKEWIITELSLQGFPIFPGRLSRWAYAHMLHYVSEKVPTFLAVCNFVKS